MPVRVNIYALTVQWARQLEESWPTHGQFPANRSSSRLMTVPCLHGHGAGSTPRDGMRADATLGPLPWRRRLLKRVASAGQGKEKTFYSGNKLVSCSAALCSDGTKGKEGYVPVSVMLMWIINHRKDWGEAMDLYPRSLFQKLGSK